MIICKLCRLQVRSYATMRPRKWKKPRAEGYVDEKYFTDYKKVTVAGGKGGDGCVSFARLWCNPFAGADGGDGGNGGHVIFQADGKKTNLSHLTDNIHGPAGDRGREWGCCGKSADHLYIQVPIGTQFRRTDDGNLLGDLKNEGEIFIGARGGAGGHGNKYFLSNEHRAPQHAEQGADGETNVLEIELKILAHAGLVGYTNAGKSTLLRAISRARPKVACYPFTTVNPSIGTIEYEDYEQLKVADIPGLLPGFHDTYGLGTSFLKHVERCLCLFYVIDLSLSEPWIQLEQLKEELERHKIGLSKRPHAVVANKCDLPRAGENLQTLIEKTELRVFPVSAKFRRGIDELLIYFREIYDVHKREWTKGC